MSSKKCDGILPNKKICGAEVFYDDAKGEQCPRECAHCGHVINEFYDETKEGFVPENFEIKYNDLVDEYNELEKKYLALVAKLPKEEKK